MAWKQTDAVYADLQKKYQAELTSKLKSKFSRFAILDIWNFADPNQCQFEEQAHGAQGDKIPDAVDKIIKESVFIPEDFEEYVLMLAEKSESVGKLLKDLREPRPGGKACIPWLGEVEVKERVEKMCAAKQIAINLRGLDMLQAKPDETNEAAWTRMKGKIGSGRHLDETTIQLPGATVPSGGSIQPPIDVPIDGTTTGTNNGDSENTTDRTDTTDTDPVVVDNPFNRQNKTAKEKLTSLSPTSGLNLLGQVETWKVGPATPLTNVAIRMSKMTGAQLQQLLKNLPDGVTYVLEAEKDA